MDGLKEFGITDDVIRKIIDNNDKALTFNLISSLDNVGKNIEYFRSIGVLVIDLLLINRMELFLVDHDKIREAFSNYDTLVLVKLINEDINAVNLL